VAHTLKIAFQQHLMQIKEMFWRASKYVEHGSPHQGLRWFKAAEIVIGHNHELT
jgi:hypothetical protein